MRPLHSFEDFKSITRHSYYQIYVQNYSALTMRPFYFIAAFPLAAIATLNGHCTGDKASSIQKANGICIHTQKCKDYGGKYTSGACPYDSDDIKCCTIGVGQPDVNPCGKPSICDWTSNSCPGTRKNGELLLSE